ncbi:MAG: YdiU family protein, partial [Deltaproteobacteria bacterium]|nr:YdiU family protein [Deltaproteobacteria bacterium]
EIFASRDDEAVLRKLTDYTIRTHFSELLRTPGSQVVAPAASASASANAASAPSPEIYAAFFAEVCRRTAVLMAQWMRVGFVHGVMNTDNMSILGLTIDYGPFGFLDNFDPNFTPNTTDAGQGRYRFANQPRIARWNLLKLAEALYPLILDVAPLEEGLALYATTYAAEEARWMAQKLGLSAYGSPSASAAMPAPDGDRGLVNDMFAVLSLAETDMTLFFRGLADVPVHLGSDAPAPALFAPIADAFYTPQDVSATAHARIVDWLRRYVARIQIEGPPDAQRYAQRRQIMNAANPKYILRNCLAQVAIDAAEQGDAKPVRELLDVLRHPYDEQPGFERFAEKRPDWARDRVGCSMLSCSS